jgi:Domain of unknown function (DUF4082)
MREILSTLFILSFLVVGGGGASSARSISIFGNAVPINPIDDPFADARRQILEFTAGHDSRDPGSTGRSRAHKAISQCSMRQSAQCSARRRSRKDRAYSRAGKRRISRARSYIAAYYCSIGQGAWDAFGLNAGVTNGPLTAPASGAAGGNGVYNNYGNVFPSSSFEDSNYYVDVAFSPAAPAPYLTLSFNPLNWKSCNGATPTRQPLPRRWPDPIGGTGRAALRTSHCVLRHRDCALAVDFVSRYLRSGSRLGNPVTPLAFGLGRSRGDLQAV